ncbi:MAG: hypothetical protein E7173_00135 [Firmicutes bacterium]|nr:hypothetical protein [Bacillota bacterium]
MKDKKITVKSGIDPTSVEFLEYYERLKTNGVNTVILDDMLQRGQKLFLTPLVFNGDDYQEYNVDDVAFIWLEDRIIGHQISSMQMSRSPFRIAEHKESGIALKKGGSKKFTRFDYYCEVDGIRNSILKYFTDRVNGQLESEIVIPYEKQITIKK